MRKQVASFILDKMSKDKDIVVITPDMGYGILDEIRDTYPERFFNSGIAEQLAVNMAVGLALSGKKPWIYGIITFTLYRALEQIRNYVVKMQLPIKFALVGKDLTYRALDHSHWALEDKLVCDAIGLRYLEPRTDIELNNMLRIMYEANKPLYLRLG